MSDPVQVTVDRAKFLEVGRVLKRAYRYSGKSVLLTLGNGRLRIEFAGGGCDLPCEIPQNLTAEITTKSFVGIIAAYNRDKSPDKTIKLTFSPELGEFATPLAGAKATFRETN